MSAMRGISVVAMALAFGGGFCLAGNSDVDYGDTARDFGDIRFYEAATDTGVYAMPETKGAANVKNVILLIGDGMGFEQVSMARTKAAGADGRLYMEMMPVKGESTTHSESGITDSAAAGTALACGIKTVNKRIGMNAEGIPFQSILEAAKEKGRKTALVATSTISHATPASFASHVGGRAMEAEISAQMLGNKVNVLLGGGRQYWIPKSEDGSKREDDRNLIEDASRMGYTVVSDDQALSEAAGDHVLGLFQMGPLTTFPPEPSLPQMTEAAIRILTRDAGNGGSGFFMMVEGSQIDWAGHANNTGNCIRQVLLFDQAVKTALDFAMNDGNTLVIATSDHETGGLARHERDFKWTSTGHTGVAVPVYAFGPGSGKFEGAMDNTDIPRRIAELLEIHEFPRAVE